MVDSSNRAATPSSMCWSNHASDACALPSRLSAERACGACRQKPDTTNCPLSCQSEVANREKVPVEIGRHYEVWVLSSRSAAGPGELVQLAAKPDDGPPPQLGGVDVPHDRRAVVVAVRAQGPRGSVRAPHRVALPD